MNSAKVKFSSTYVVDSLYTHNKITQLITDGDNSFPKFCQRRTQSMASI